MNMISIRATGVNLVIKRNSHQQFEKDEALDHTWPLCFANEMKMGNIKTNTSLWVSSRKIKDLLHVSLWNNLEKNIVIQGQIAIPEASSPGKGK